MSITVFQNARIVDPSRGMDETGTVIVDGDKIVAAGASALNQGIPGGAKVIDCTGRAIIPGLVDGRVFIGEPGGEHRETIASASLAAAAGGVTSIVMMPDTDPVIDNVALVEFVLRAARDTAIVNVFPAAAITKGLEGREMTEFGLLREAGAVAFTDGRHTISNALTMRRALTYARDFGAVIAHETQDRDLAASGVMNEGLFASWLGLPGMPREAEAIPLERDLMLARLTGGAYHAAKISTALSAAAIARAKSDGASVTAGVSVNHLSLNENDVGEYRTFFRLSPPLRAEDDRLAMIEALRDGTIDIVVSSHDPQDVDTKRLPFADAADGAIGLETLLAVALRLYHNGDLPLLRLIEVLSTAPGEIVRPARRLAGARKCRRSRRGRSRRTVDRQRRRDPVALEEHLLRGRAAAGQSLANDGCGPHSVLGLTLARERQRARGLSMSYVPFVALAFGYLLGSIPFGLLITRAAGLGDVRNIGSGNIGATNVLRTGNKGLAAADADRRRAEGHRRGADRRPVRRGTRHGGRFRRVSRPHLPGLARLQGRQGRRDLSRRAVRRWPGRPDLSSSWSGSRLPPSAAIRRWPRSSRRVAGSGLSCSGLASTTSRSCLRS